MTTPTFAHPGSLVTSTAVSGSSGAESPTGTAFVTGLAQRGPVGTPVECLSEKAWADTFGADVAYSYCRQWVRRFFGRGGSKLWFSRVLPTTAAPAAKTLNDSAGTPAAALTVTANSAGDWGNDLKVDVLAPAGGGRVLVVKYLGVEVTRSTPFTANADAVAWAQTSDWVVVEAVGSNLPAAAVDQALTGGNDQRGSVTDADYDRARALFAAGLGCGQVVDPGRTTANAWAAVVKDAARFAPLSVWRDAILDAPDVDAATLAAQALALRNNAEVEEAAYQIVGGWNRVTGTLAGSTSLVPPSAYACAMVTVTDTLIDAGHSPAGYQHRDAGVVFDSLGLTREYSNDDWDALFLAGVNLFRTGDDKRPVLTSWRSGADPDKRPEWVPATQHRLRMQVTAIVKAILDQYVEITATKVVIDMLVGQTRDALTPFWERGTFRSDLALAQALVIDAGPAINTPTTLGLAQLREQVEYFPESPVEHAIAELIATTREAA